MMNSLVLFLFILAGVDHVSSNNNHFRSSSSHAVVGPNRYSSRHRRSAVPNSKAAHFNVTNAKLPRSSGGTYKLVDKFAGQSFFDEWDFFTGGDPTHGQVAYQGESDARSKKLAYVQSDNTVVMAVDDYTQLNDGENRASVRITTKKTYNKGLFIMDTFAMPHGCSVWPAWWTVGPNWPLGGEIDIIEGVHEQQQNQYTLHTADGCSLDPGADFTSRVLGQTCASGNGHNDGCGFLDDNANSFGHGFNLVAGGVFAMLWDDSGIKTYHWPRSVIPSDIQNFAPDPSSWSTPAASWPASSCEPGKFFQDHSMVIDTTLCGDWAGASFSSAGCPGTCSSYVADPSHFTLAKWKINYVATYQLS